MQHSPSDVGDLLEVLSDTTPPVEPRIWTPRDPDRPTLGPLFATIADFAGLELLPWQQLIADTALELTGPRLWRYRGLTLLVGRQSGKTRVVIVRILMGLFGVEWERLILHTAQDRSLPTATFQEIITAIEGSKVLRRQIPKGGIQISNGKEHIRTKDGSEYRIKAPRPAAFRGPSASLLIFDEAREQHDHALWAAAVPTQSAAVNPQRWIVSNAGENESVVLNEQSDVGRLAAEDPSTATVAYAEYSAPDGAAVTDPEAIAAANPGLNTLLSPAAVLDELAILPEDRYRTERLCQRVATSAPMAIPLDGWQECGGDPGEIPHGTIRPVFGFDLDPSRTAGALVSAAWVDDRLVVQLLESWERPEGIDERLILPRVAEWVRQWRPTGIGFYAANAGAIGEWITTQGLPSKPITAAKWYTACQQLWEAVANRTLLHPRDPNLSTQVLAAARREVGDGLWMLSRRDAEVPIPAAMALARAVHLAYLPAPRPAIQ